MPERLKLEDLYIGRHVTFEELKDIYDVYIILENVSGYDTRRIAGDIIYITEDPDAISDKHLMYRDCFCICNDSIDADEDCGWDE